MREAIKEALKEAMKARDAARVATLRMISATLKDRDVEARGKGREAASDDELGAALVKMVRQREEAAKAYDDGGRPELAAKERAEIEVIRSFMPKQMDEAETRAAIEGVVKELGASGLKDMGKVMGELKTRYAGKMDFGKANGVVKAVLG